MKTKKRLLLLILSACFCLAVTVGCKNKGNSGNSNYGSSLHSESTEAVESEESGKNCWSDENADGNGWT